MEPINLGAATLEQINSQRSELVNLSVPEDLSEQQSTQVEQAVQNAFVQGFRFVTLTCAGLAVLSAVAAWFTIKDEEASEDEDDGAGAAKAT